MSAHTSDLQQSIALIVQEELTKQFRTVPVGISNRHVHLCRADVEKLFGKGYQLQKFRDLSQPGQYACKEQVTVVGPKGKLERVRVLGPERKDTQVEIALTDSFALGIRPPVRMSGKIAGSPGCKLIGSAGETDISEGVIVAARHLHISAEQAALFGLKDGQAVRLKSTGERAVILENVVVRAGNGHDLEVHIDTDEANALAMSGSPMMEVLP